MECVGIDVSKRVLTCAVGSEVREFANSEQGFKALGQWSSHAQTWCLEATGRYHQPLAAYGYEQGLRLLIVNPGRAKKYLDFVASRAKTDRIDAQALQTLGQRESEACREYRPVPEAVAKARDILVGRRSLVQARVALEQVASETGDPGGHLKSSIATLNASVKELDKSLLKALKGYPRYADLLGMPGIGPQSAALLVCALERGEFATSDSLVAFAGLDPRPRESGRFKGTRSLSHQGDAQLRTVLFMAARAGARMPYWKPYYVKQLAKGLSTTEATVILARKMMRVAWKVYKQGSPFIPMNEPEVDKTT